MRYDDSTAAAGCLTALVLTLEVGLALALLSRDFAHAYGGGAGVVLGVSAVGLVVLTGWLEQTAKFVVGATWLSLAVALGVLLLRSNALGSASVGLALALVSVALGSVVADRSGQRRASRELLRSGGAPDLDPERPGQPAAPGHPLVPEGPCGACKQPIARDAGACADCHAPYHRTCFQLRGGCADVLCGGEQVDRRAVQGAAAEVERIEGRCPYCTDDLGTDPRLPVGRCDSCQTPHHLACFHENGRCTILGCAGVRILRA